MPLIARAKDLNKDQTYFIWQIKREQLPHILFPVGEFDAKSEVRDYAQSMGLITSNKPDSQGLCFVGQTSLRDMLLQTLGQKNGFIYAYLNQEQVDQIGIKLTKKNSQVRSDSNKFKVELGVHQGSFLYTIGQRQNLGISNGPWFVAEVDIENNEVIVCHQEFQTSILSNILMIKDLNWHIDITNNAYTQSKLLNSIEKFELKNKLINSKYIGFKNEQFNNFFESYLGEDFSITQLNLKAQIRYRSEAQDCTVYIFTPGFDQQIDGNLGVAFTDNVDNSFAIVEFDQPIKAAAKGQSIVFYDQQTDRYLLGGGVIDKVIQ